MKEKSICLDLKNNKDYDKLYLAGEALKNGELVIFPTETVYGIGANGLDENAVLKIYEAKGRKSDNPLILHIDSILMLNSIVKSVGKIEKKLIDNFWPGPLTIIFEKKSVVPSVVSGNLDTVGVRMPNNEIALELIKYAKVPIAAPSANISGKPSGTKINDIKDEFMGKVKYIIDEGNTKIGLESTVVRVIDDIVYILRPGFVTKEDLISLGLEVIVDKNVLEKSSGGPVLSPGVKYKHYAPITECMLIYGNDKMKVINKIKEMECKYKNSIVLTFDSHVKCFNKAVSWGESLEEISHNMYSFLRRIDKENYEMIIIEGVDFKGLGLAIMNRLLRACSYNYIEV